MFMGLLEGFKDIVNKDTAFSLYSMFKDDPKKMIKKYKTKEALLLEVIRLTGTPKKRRDYYIIAHSYVDLGAKYRPQAIIALTQYLKKGGYWSGTPNDTIDMGDYKADQRKECIAAEWECLGKAYEGEYIFDEAMRCYREAMQLTPYSETPVMYIADLYVKMNDINSGLAFLTEIKKSRYKNMKQAAVGKYKELKAKKASGYVYKPRSRKGAANSSQPT